MLLLSVTGVLSRDPGILSGQIWEEILSGGFCPGDSVRENYYVRILLLGAKLISGFRKKLRAPIFLVF